VVKKLHRQLGHPGNDRLVKALKDANFDETIIKCGRQFRCDICESFAPKKLDRPASLPQTTHFNDMLEMDVFHIKWHGQKHKILAVLDLHTRYEMNEVVNSESFDEETAALERWMSWAGVPRRIKADSSGAHMGEEMQSWCDEYGIKHHQAHPCAKGCLQQDGHHRASSCSTTPTTHENDEGKYQLGHPQGSHHCLLSAKPTEINPWKFSSSHGLGIHP
jgi:transposase InsO family protein